jgi:WD40 repeat protein
MGGIRKSEEQLFEAARKLADPGHRRAFLQAACQDDPALRRRVEQLLEDQSAADDFFADARIELPTPAAVIGQMTENPGDRIGRYKLLEKIGEGGMGVVYMAEQQEPVRRKVALKVIKLGMDTKQVIARFEAERQALALMDHPNIAKVLDAGLTDTGRPYFVMELVQGVPITEFCDKNRLSNQERIKLFIPVCQAIQSAHQKGIIHRDLKPTNILVTLNAGVPLPMVIDFGVAKATNQKLTEKTVFTNFAAMIGTPAYMSPEQAEMSRLDVDTRTDIYGLGVLLYELLTGTTPFPEKRLRSVGYQEMQRIIVEEQPERPSTRLRRTQTLGKSLSARSPLPAPRSTDLDWIVMKCLEKDRERRYETANGLAMDLQRHLNNEPVVARPPSNLYRLQKLVRRNRLAFAAAGAVAAALLLGLGISTWLFIRESEARRRAESAEREQSRLREAAQKAQANEAEERRSAEAQAYVANMNLAQQAWEQNDPRRLRVLLDRTASYPDRGFEWYYWQRQLHLELKTLRGHSGAVSSVAFSPDGRRIVTGSYDHTAKVWEADTFKELLTLGRHGGRITSVSCSPDGRRMATGNSDHTATVWDTATGKELVTLEGHNGAVVSVAFSPDGQQVATGSEDATAKVWDAATGQALLTLTGHTARVATVVFSPDGRCVATASWDNTARVWDAGTGEKMLTLTGHSNAVASVAFCPDGQRIVTGGFDGTVRVWEMANGKQSSTFNDLWSVCSVAFSPDGRRILAGGGDGTARVWEAAGGKTLLTLKGHRHVVCSVAFSPDGQRIVTGSNDGTAKVWRAIPGNEALSLKGHTNWVTSLAFSPDGRRLVTGSLDQTAKVWDTARAKELLTLKSHTDVVFSVAFSPDGQWIVTGSADGTAKVWEAATGKELRTLRGHTATVIGVAIAPDGGRIATASLDRTARVWDAASGQPLLTLTGHVSYVLSVAFSPDGRRIATGGFDNTAKVWDAISGRELLTLAGHAGVVRPVAFSPDGQQIVTGSADGTAAVWEAESGRRRVVLAGHDMDINSVAFSPDGSRIVTGSMDGTAKVWDAGSGQELLTLKRHGNTVSSVAFSPDGRRIATGSLDNTAKVWEAASADQVTGWQREEEADTKRLAGQMGVWAAHLDLDAHEVLMHAREPGAIKQWLVLAPIPFAGQTNPAAVKALDEEQIPREAWLRPRAGDRVTVGGQKLAWREAPGYVIDFNQLLNEPTEWSVAYAIAYLQSDTACTGLQMHVGSDDEAKIYLNGREIYRNPTARECIPDQDVVEGVELKAGLNVLVFKVVNEALDWKGSVRFTDAAGQPVKGIRITLTAP